MKKLIPILYNTEMVKAKLAGRKTQTRRTKGLELINENPDEWRFAGIDFINNVFLFEHIETQQTISLKCTYGNAGDVMYVRESFIPYDLPFDLPKGITYTADGKSVEIDHNYYNYKKRGGIHMPKLFTRIWDEIEVIKPQRLQLISEADAIAEGIQIALPTELQKLATFRDYMASSKGYGHPDYDFPTTSTPISSFKSLWQKINGKESWDANPWVWGIHTKNLSLTGKPENI